MVVAVDGAQAALSSWLAWLRASDPGSARGLLDPHLFTANGGWIYFARMPGFIKVGITAHVGGRLASLKTDLALKAKPELLVAIGPVGWCCESQVLRLLKPWRTPLRGPRSREWFTWCEPVANMVNRLREAA